MDNSWTRSLCRNFTLLMLISTVLHHSLAETCDSTLNSDSVLDRDLKEYVDEVLSANNFSVFPGLVVEKLDNVTLESKSCERGRSEETLEDYVKKKLDEYSETHVLTVNVEQTARFFSSNSAEAAATTASTDTGKSSFLMGFGMGFLAFFLKKLLLPVFIGAQLIKSVLIAMFLPTILGGVGKLVGKGLSTFSGLSGASAGINNQHQQQIEDFEFKDADPYNNDGTLGTDIEGDAGTLTLHTVDGSTPASTNSRLGFVNNQRVYTAHNINDNNYYMRKPNKKTDYKVFHKIPSSSMLLTSYDPFYSPLLSRLDAVFQQLGLEGGKSAATERCRERLVCLMYANPAKYAPYSNLVSAQLSRELNELRKPSSDNPEILRFFRYMKAAKDGQDGEECLAHGGCPYLTSKQPSPALLTTYNDINKLVQARKLH